VVVLPTSVPTEVIRAVSVPGGADSIATGADTRAGSVRAGLRQVCAEAEVVVVHDAARPLASPGLFEAVVKAVLEGADGAVPGVAVGDTVKRVDAGIVAGTVERSELVAVQTPQAFRAGVLRRAHEGDPEATDDSGLVEASGATVRVVPGETTNIKVTEASDLDLARALMGGFG
jgi:2-C-methyl-D-erythritol 4-phosphate cytidylyltransferase